MWMQWQLDLRQQQRRYNEWLKPTNIKTLDTNTRKHQNNSITLSIQIFPKIRYDTTTYIKAMLNLNYLFSATTQTPPKCNRKFCVSNWKNNL